MAENEDGESSEFVVAPGALPTAFVFKTISDQYGKYSYVKVLSGSIKPDMPMVNARTGETEKLGRLYIPKGKKYTEVKELTCGDIGASPRWTRSRPAIRSASRARSSRSSPSRSMSLLQRRHRAQDPRPGG